MSFINRTLSAFFYSFPIQLLLNNLKRNHFLLLFWIILVAMITGNIGRYMGIPYLFLDPEYLNKVNFTSFFIVGITTAGLTTAFHITCYITDGHRFSFIGALPKPFTKFSLNNSLLPVIFLVLYLYEMIRFQLNNQYSTPHQVFINISGFIVGFIVMTLLFAVYFWFTNKDIFKYVVCRIDEKIKSNVQVTRASALKKLDIARKKQVRVDNYLDYDGRFKKTDDTAFYDKATVLQVFDQNHFNLIIIQLFIFVFVLILGIFKDFAAFQLPVGASFMILLTILMMITGAFSYWFGGWSLSAGLVIFLFINELTGAGFFNKKYQAFGLDYKKEAAPYNIENLRLLNDSTHIKADQQLTLQALQNWRNKFPADKKPKMVFVCVSGGGKRAALWSLNALQTADSLTNGAFFNHTMLITGASGGLIGASYFRELKLREKLEEKINPYNAIHRQKISTDNLNPLIFSLLANDLFVGFNKFEYAGIEYTRDRAYTFEDQLNQITEKLMDKPVKAYLPYELNATIPMLILTPTVVNDGRKIYISALPVAYMNSDLLNYDNYNNTKISGVDFMTLFKNQQGDSLRFLSALRMSATFPYITPTTTLPTEPPIEMMDAGISDNFGLSDAMRFLYAFHGWIEENTSGVVIVSIRDSPKVSSIKEKVGQTILDSFSQPISSVYNNFENFQDITSDNLFGYTKTWFRQPIDRIDVEYQAETYVDILNEMDSLRQTNARASLSWRLTMREKIGLIENINTRKNKDEILKLRELLR
ncbi:patatin-like phospholipase family protein [Chryseotalea sanaruensis]|nr:patatin-like phospholipase family protein [Chryseotalea sanaruensis]